MRVAGRVRISAAALWQPSGRARAVDAVGNGSLAQVDAREALCDEVAVSVPGGPPAWEMGLQACRHALSEVTLPASEVDFLSYAGMSATKEIPASPVHRLARLLGVNDGVAVGVDQMSSGGDMALHTAVSALLTEPRTRHAIACTGINTDGLPYDRWITAPEVVLGDGATAVVLCRDRGALSIQSIGRAGCAEMELAYPRFHPFRPVPPGLGEQAGTLDFMRNATAIRETTGRAVDQALADAGATSIDRVRLVCASRIRPRTIQLLVQGALPPTLRDRVLPLGQTTGHLGPGDTLANLAEVLDRDLLAAGDLALFVGLGAGFTVSALVVKRL